MRCRKSEFPFVYIIRIKSVLIHESIFIWSDCANGMLPLIFAVRISKGLLHFKHFKKGKRKVQGVPQSETAALPRHQEEEETDKTKQAQIEQTYEKH